jgi:phage tail-like protein
MRGAIEGLASPHPLVEGVPAVFRYDELTPRLLAGLDMVLAPVFATLDCLDAYIDPRLTPEDFLPWLAGWVGLEPDQRWSDDQLRELMRVTIGLYRLRGTVRGIREVVKAYAGVDPEVTDSGGATVVPRRPLGAGDAATVADFPGSSDPWVRVRVAAQTSPEITEARLRSLIRPMLPAHLRVAVEVGAP